MTVGNCVLLRNVSEYGSTGKLRSHWEGIICVVIEKTNNIPLLIIKSENGICSTIEKIHQNNIIPCNLLTSKP